MRKIYIILSLLILVLTGCNQNSMRYRSAIQQANYFQVFKVAMSPTRPEEQSPDKLYVLDYEVIDTRLVEEAQVPNLKKALLNKNNYSFEDNKRCPFLASYGVKIDSDLMAIVGRSPCSKIMLSEIDKSENQIYDLAEDSDIESVLAGVLGED